MLRSNGFALVASLLVHVLVLSLFLVNWHPEHKVRKIQPKTILATLVSKDQLNQKSKKPKTKPVKKPKVKKKPKPKPKPVKKPEPVKKPKPKPVKKPPVKTKPKPKPVKKPEQSKEDRAKALAAALAAEDEQLEQEEQQNTAASDAELAQGYESYIYDRVVANWSRPPSARRGMTATLEIRLLPTGQVVGVRILKGSGNAAFDRSVEQAVRKVGGFDQLKNMPPRIFEQRFRKVILDFDPEDLRL